MELNAPTATDIGDEVAISPQANDCKVKSYDELVANLMSTQNVIECRAITQASIQKWISIISEKDSTRGGMQNIITIRNDIMLFHH